MPITNETLCLMIQNGNHEACTQLIERNTMFIRSAAIQFEKRYGGAVLSCDDYEQEGRIALLHAAERFVPEKGKFLTYAAVVVCTAMLDPFGKHIPKSIRFRWKKTRQQLKPCNPIILFQVGIFIGKAPNSSIWTRKDCLCSTMQ